MVFCGETYGWMELTTKACRVSEKGSAKEKKWESEGKLCAFVL